ncbi:MAG: hypothetical protein ACXVK4_17475 [Acidimicrobiia bacterium]
MRIRLVVPVLVGVVALSTTACSSEGGSAASATRPRHDAQKHKIKHSSSMAGMTAAEMAAMGHATAVDDRGFAELANGEQHTHGFTQPVSKADRVLLGHQMELARQTALRYPTVADAEAAGLRRAGPFSPGLGAHYINYGNGGGSPDGVMTDDAIGKPLAWIYDGTHPDSHIAGLFYMTGVKNPVGFAGPNDVWHVHHDVCIKPGPDGVDAPLGADHGATKAQCDKVGGSLLKQTQYLLHAWVVPGYESPEGVYAHLSSAITCDDGTYHVIADVTKVGSRHSMCVDGTE